MNSSITINYGKTGLLTLKFRGHLLTEHVSRCASKDSCVYKYVSRIYVDASGGYVCASTAYSGWYGMEKEVTYAVRASTGEEAAYFFTDEVCEAMLGYLQPA